MILTVCLLLTNILLSWINKKEPAPRNPEAKIVLIDSLFNVAISKFNLDSTWIKSIPINSNQYDSLNTVYRIKLPNDLRPAVVLLEITELFSDLPVDLISDEKAPNAETTLNILSNEKLKLQATFSVDNDIERKHSNFAFVVTDISAIDKETELNMYHSVIPFSVLIKPSTDKDSLLRKISEFKKSYSVLIDDGIEEDNFKLEPGLSKTRLKESVRYITWTFPSAELFVVNDKSSLFHSAIFNFIRDEFKARDTQLYLLNDFITLAHNYDEAESLLKFYLESGIGKKGKIVFMRADVFNQLNKLLLNAKQRGTKFYSPVELLNLNSQPAVSN